MSKFEEAVKIIAEEYMVDCVINDCTIRELFKDWEMDYEDLRADFLDILNESEEFDGYFTDDCKILDDDGKFKTFRQLAKAVRDYQFPIPNVIIKRPIGFEKTPEQVQKDYLRYRN